MTRRLPAWALLAPLLLVLALGACRRDAADSAKAPGDPVAAVLAQAKALEENDLARFSRLSLPKDLHARTEALWNQRVAQAEPATERESAEFERMMGRLTAPDAKEALARDIEPRLAQLEGEISGQWPLMQATALIFLKAAIAANAELTDTQKAHGTDVATSLVNWVQPGLITDRARARTAIGIVVDTAQSLELPTLAQARALEMMPALEKGGVALAGLKQVGKTYGLDMDLALAGVAAEVVSAEGELATVKVSYPLLGETISFELPMERRDGGWYSAESLRQAESELAEAGEASGQPAPAAG
jgi:hypothetical protein